MRLSSEFFIGDGEYFRYLAEGRSEKISLYKDTAFRYKKYYGISEKNYIFHTFSRVLRFFCFSCLKKVGVSPVIFLNWVERWATLL